MDEQRESSQAAHSVGDHLGKGTRPRGEDHGSEGECVSQSSSNKFRRLDRESGRVPTGDDQSNRFLFVDSSSTGQRARSDQRAINAHIQQTAHRNRRAAAAKRIKASAAANIGRNRRETAIQPRPIEIQPGRSPGPNIQHSPSPSIPSVASRTSTSRSSEVDQDLVDRLRYYSNVRTSEVRRAINSPIENAQSEHDLAVEERDSLRTMLTQILQRLDAGNRGHSIHGSPVLSLSNTLIDPFNSSSVSITPSMNTALRHFSDVMLPSIFPTRVQAGIQTRWAFQHAAEEPLVLYSLLAVAAAERSARLGEVKNGSEETTLTEADLENRTVPDFVSYRVNAVKHANDSLKSMDTAVKASTIFAMMCLLSIEVITGNQQEIFAQVSGLQKLIALRSGYHGIPGHITELILSTSYMCAAMTRTLPPSPPTSTLPCLPSTLVEEIRKNVHEDIKPMGTGILKPEVDRLLDWRISQAVRDMIDVIQYREYYHERQIQPLEEELDHINAKSYQFRYAVQSVPFEPRAAPPSDKEEACRLAMLIFWFSNYQLMRPDSALFRRLTAQLKTALEASDLKGLWNPHFELLMWVLLLGANISAGQRERPWFVLHLAKVSLVLELTHWSDVRRRLTQFFYLDRIYGNEMQASWDEATLLAETLE